jgi:phenylacetate-CoA ligase
MLRRLGFLERAQWWDADRVAAERDARLRDLVRVAYEEVPLYRSLFEQAGIRPVDIQGKGDLRKVPAVTKQILRAAYPDRVTRPTGRRTYEASTSGSTGKNFKVREDDRTAARYRAAFLLAAGWTGWQAGDRHLQLGMNLTRDSARRLKDRLLRCQYVSAYDLTDSSLDRTLDVIQDRHILFLWGYPGSLYYLARRARSLGWNTPVHAAVTWGDTLFPEFRRTIQDTFRTTVFDTYGCAEGIQVSAQCGAGPWYHVHELDTIVEYVDDDGAPVPQGTPGNLLLTRLYPGPMPLIRYQVGDVGTSGAGRTCGCGRSWEVMEDIRGRRTDVVITPNGNRLIVHFFTGILEYFTEIDTFQVVQDASDHILIRIVPAGPVDGGLPGRVIAAIRQKGAGDLSIDVETVGEIPPTAGGKRRFVVSQFGATSGLPPV